MMRHALPFEVNKISQWKFFYYNYALLDEVVQTLENLALIRDHLRTMVMSNSPLGNQHVIIYTRQHMLIQVVQYMHQVNSIFFRLRNHEMELTYIFSQMKSQELSRKAKFYFQITEYCEKGMDDCLILLENTYIENEFLHRLVEFSMQKQEVIMTLHKNISKKYEDFDTPSIDDKRIERLTGRIKRVSQEMKNRYSFKWIGQKKFNQEQKAKKLAKDSLKGIVRNQKDEQLAAIIGDSLLKFLIGVMGFTLIVLIYLIIYYDINLEEDENFKNLFPIWRGLLYFIVYNWILGFNTLIFEKHHINYRKILNLERNKIPKAQTLFFSATIFSILYLILYILFILKLRNFFEFNGFRLDMFPAVGWLAFLGIIFYPFDFTYYFSSILVLMFVSPIIGVNFTSNWLSQQLSSFKQPFHDISYTILYYLGTYDDLDQSWQEARFIGACIGTYIYLLRIFQGMRKGCALGKYFIGVPLFKGCLKCIFNITTIWMAFLYRANGQDPSFLAYWIIAGAISTSYAYTYDIVYDWNLIQKSCCSGEKIMRKKRILGMGEKKLYIFFMLTNLVLRVAWLFTISSDFIIANFNSPYVFIMIVSILEIVRRGIWNLVYIQKEHVMNCQKFDCMVNDTSIENHVIQEYLGSSEDEIQKERRKVVIENYKKDVSYKAKSDLQLQTLQKMIKKSQEIEEYVQGFLTKSRKDIKQIREELGIKLKDS